MRRIVYSLYEAKAKFSEIIRRVREGRTVTVSYRGEPVAEIRPLGAGSDGPASRLRALRDRGVLVSAEKRRGALRAITRKPGALKRFLRDRDA